MFSRRVMAVGVVVTAVATTTGVASAAPFTVTSKYAQVDTGTVSITQTDDPAGGVDYAVSIKGRIRDHGWTYDGELSGVRHTTESFTENLSIIGPFDVTADPAGVTGMCDTYSTVGETVSSDAPVDTAIYCVLSKDGSTPWLTVIDSTLAPVVTDGTSTTWRGPYIYTQTTTPGIGAKQPPPTHGDSQVVENSYGGDGMRYTLQLSGQIAIGSSLYTGEISSDWSDRFYLHFGNPTPTVNVSGSSNGHTVAGPCTGTWTSSGWDFDCNLSLDSAPAADVKLTITDGDSGSFCGDTADGTYQCDTYTTGSYT